MTATLAYIWRHPIKGIGAEACGIAKLSVDGAVEGDRVWAVLNDVAPDTDEWQPRRNFLQVASGPRLAAVRAETTDGGVRLSHPARETMEFDLPGSAAALNDWIGDLWPMDRPGPARLVRAPRQGMTDVPFASVSIGNLSTLKAVSQKTGLSLDMRRFRINLWIEGLAPFEEIDLLKSDLQIGSVTLSPVEPIERCRAPDANPDTGQRDLSMLGSLERGWETRDFGVYFKVAAGGTVAVGDTLRIA